MATSKKKLPASAKASAAKGGLKVRKPASKAASKARPSKAGAKAKAGGAPPKLWMVPVGLLLVLLAVGAFLVNHARYLASLKFDMVRVAAVVPQGHDQGQATGLANLAGDPAGHAFVLEADGVHMHPVRLQRFDQEFSPNSIVYQGAKDGQDLTDASDVDCDPKGVVYVLLRDGRVQVLDNDLHYLKTIQTGVSNASALSVNSAGRIYLADTPDNKVVYFNAEGIREGEFGAPGKGDPSLVAPIFLRVGPTDEVLVVESTPTGMRGRIFAKDNTLRKTFLVDKIQGAPPVRMGINSQNKVFFNDQAGSLGIVCWDLSNGKYFGAAQATKDGVKFVSPGCIGANRYTPDVYVHTVPGLIKCVLPSPSGGQGAGQ